MFKCIGKLVMNSKADERLRCNLRMCFVNSVYGFVECCDIAFAITFNLVIAVLVEWDITRL